ncbi:hypothetical protein ACLEPN_10820 [Myxococcus sp. 1LA]
MMVKDVSHKWEFKARFRRHAFGWKSQPAITRIKQAVTEIKHAAKKAPVLAAEGAVLFLERVSPALAHVDSSSGAIGTAVNHAINELVPLIASAPVDAATRDAWLERLWEAYQADDIPYIESLGHHWGTLCAAPEVASAWANRLIGTVRLTWSPSPWKRASSRSIGSCRAMATRSRASTSATRTGQRAKRRNGRATPLAPGPASGRCSRREDRGGTSWRGRSPVSWLRRGPRHHATTPPLPRSRRAR